MSSSKDGRTIVDIECSLLRSGSFRNVLLMLSREDLMSMICFCCMMNSRHVELASDLMLGAAVSSLYSLSLNRRGYRPTLMSSRMVKKSCGIVMLLKLLKNERETFRRCLRQPDILFFIVKRDVKFSDDRLLLRDDDKFSWLMLSSSCDSVPAVFGLVSINCD